MNLVITVCLCVLTIANGAKILGLFHRPSNAHRVLSVTLFKALAKRGHEVTLLNPHSQSEPTENYEDIKLSGIAEYNTENDVMKKFIEMHNSSMLDKLQYGGQTVDDVNERFLSDPAVISLLSSNRTFDLMIMLWVANEAFLGISHHFQVPVIALSSIGSSLLTNIPTKNPAPYSYISGLFPLFPSEMNFFQRFINTVSSLYIESTYVGIGIPKQAQLLKQHFPDAPPLDDLISNISLFLINTHHSIESPRPYVPSMVQIGGLHLQDAEELKGDLKEFLDSAKEGALLFSLGSVFKGTDLPEEKLRAILDGFSRLPLKVLWKFERDNITGLPPNVKIDKWFPQKDVLGHPNIKVFVTHGGLLSSIEALYHGVPLVGIPLFGDQDGNVDDAVHKGYAVRLSYTDLTSETLVHAVNLVLNDKRYAENIEWRSRVLRDEPLKPLDKAIYWVEYVLRYKGAHHLKTSAIKLKWYQLYLIDVIAACVALVFVACSVVYVILRIITRLFMKMFYKTKVNLSIYKKNL